MPTSNHSKQILIGHVRYINILTWILAFQANFYISWCFLCIQVSFGNWETKETLKKFIFDLKESEPYVRILIHIERGKTQFHVCARHFFCSQVFKTLDVLNSDKILEVLLWLLFACWRWQSWLTGRCRVYSCVVWVSGQ